jgi:hypothetical protein
MSHSFTKPHYNAALPMHRELGPFEHLLWLVDQWTPRHFLFVARIEGSTISVEELNAALLQSQRRHPILRTGIQVNGDGRPEFVPSYAPIPLRVVRRAHDAQWLGEVETQLAHPFYTEDRPLLRVSLVQGEAVSELILTVHHTIGDGVSAMYLVRDLLEYMEGYSIEELPPRCAAEDLFDSAPAIPVTQKQPAAMSSNGAARFERPYKTSLQVFEIGRGELDRILSRCRLENTTFQGALLAALLLSLPGQAAVQCLAPINVRGLLRHVTEDFGLYISSGMAAVDRSSAPDFWSLARSARQQVMQAFDLGALRAKADAMASVVAAKPGPQATYERVWRSGSYSAVLTNLGRFPEMPKLQRFRVTAAYPILSPELEPVVAVATADRRAYITVSSPSELVELSSKFFDQLRQHTK